MSLERAPETSLTPPIGDRFAEALEQALKNGEQAEDSNFWQRSWEEISVFGISRTATINRGFSRYFPGRNRVDVQKIEKKIYILGTPFRTSRELLINRWNFENEASSRVEFNPSSGKVKISNRSRHPNDRGVLLPIVVHEYKAGSEFYDQVLSHGLSVIEELYDEDRGLSEAG